MIHFNRPYYSGKESEYIAEAVENKKISGNGAFTKKCHDFFERKYDFGKCLLTTSCTDALEMIAILLNVKEGDEIIMPSYTFVSSANAFVRQGAKIVFADSRYDLPNIDEDKIESLITSRTKAILVVHYAGIAVDMNRLMHLADKHDLFVIEDAAHSIDSYYHDQPLGSIGHFATFSFHETKNISAGEGGMLVINDSKFEKRSEIIWEKGTNRTAFFRGEVDKYGWVDIGSSFLPSDITAAFLYAQLEQLERIQKRRVEIWDKYQDAFSILSDRGRTIIPIIPSYGSKNGHLYYIITESLNERNELISYLKSKKINTVFHYLPLHQSEFYREKHDGRELPNANLYADRLLRFPLYFELANIDQERIIDETLSFFN